MADTDKTNRGLIDGEVLGLDVDGCIICWDADKGETYNSGETLEDFAGLLFEEELRRLGLDEGSANG